MNYHPEIETALLPMVEQYLEEHPDTRARVLKLRKMSKSASLPFSTKSAIFKPR